MRLRNLQQKDVPFIYEWMKDPSVNCFFRFDAEQVSLETVQDFVSNAQAQEENLHLACVNEEDEYLGTISLKHIDQKDKTAEYAISFRKCAHGTGAARYATKEILRLEKVYLNVLTENVHACHFYEKVGFHYEGCSRSQISIAGKRRDLNWYGMTKEDWTCTR